MPTDLDRLHRVALHGGGRGCGKTFLACHILAGTLELARPHESICWVLPVMRWLWHIRPMLDEVLCEHDIPFEWVRKDVLRAGTHDVLFTSSRDRARGFHYYIEEDWHIPSLYSTVARKCIDIMQVIPRRKKCFTRESTLD